MASTEERAEGSEVPRLLPRPPEEGARLLALSFLDQAAAARPRLDDSADTEALHDFRVALRRLRSCLQAYGDSLDDSIPRKLARRLKKLADATGAGRDTEVQIEWLREAGKGLAAAHRPGHAWLLARLEKRKGEAYEEIAADVADDFAGLEAELRRKLSVYRTEVRLDRDRPRRTLGAAAAELLHALAGELADHLAQVDSSGAETEAHKARIRAKRLRYLLEPFREEVPEAIEVVQRIKGLQDLLGELHDAHVLEHELEDALGEAAEARAKRLLDLTLEDAPNDKLLRAERRRRHEPGLLALAKRNRARRDSLYKDVAQGWLDGRAGDFLDLRWLEAALAAAGGG
jgi:CHAD domain-containing protein